MGAPPRDEKRTSLVSRLVRRCDSVRYYVVQRCVGAQSVRDELPGRASCQCMRVSDGLHAAWWAISSIRPNGHIQGCACASRCSQFSVSAGPGALDPSQLVLAH